MFYLTPFIVIIALLAGIVFGIVHAIFNTYLSAYSSGSIGASSEDLSVAYANAAKKELTSKDYDSSFTKNINKRIKMIYSGFAVLIIIWMASYLAMAMGSYHTMKENEKMAPIRAAEEAQRKAEEEAEKLAAAEEAERLDKEARARVLFDETLTYENDDFLVELIGIEYDNNYDPVLVLNVTNKLDEFLYMGAYSLSIREHCYKAITMVKNEDEWDFMIDEMIEPDETREIGVVFEFQDVCDLDDIHLSDVCINFRNGYARTKDRDEIHYNEMCFAEFDLDYQMREPNEDEARYAKVVSYDESKYSFYCETEDYEIYMINTPKYMEGYGGYNYFFYVINKSDVMIDAGMRAKQFESENYGRLGITEIAAGKEALLYYHVSEENKYLVEKDENNEIFDLDYRKYNE